MPIPCVIRFIDEDGEYHATVLRKQHGHPEDIITNLVHLHSVIRRFQDQPSPGNLAATFVFLDTLWYVVQDGGIDHIEEELLSLLETPTESDIHQPSSHLRQHEILDSSTSIEPVPYLFQVELRDNTTDWPVSIAHNTDSRAAPVDEVFASVEWEFSGDLSEAESRFL